MPLDTSEPNHHGFPGGCRIPDDAAIAPGRVVVCWREAPNHESELNVFGVHKARYSDDEGETFSAEYVIQTGVTPYHERGAALGALSDGTVILASIAIDVVDEVTTVPDAGRIRRSTDGGITFGSPVVVETPGFEAFSAGHAPVIELDNGDLLWTMYGFTAGSGGNNHCLVYRSQDGGLTWAEIGTLVPNNGHINQEPNLVNLGDRVLGLIRVQEDPSGARWIWKSYSEDGGETWSAATRAFEGFGAAHCVRMADGTLIATIRGPNKWGLLNNHAKVWTSLDEGASWLGPWGLDETAYDEDAYASPVPLGNGTDVGVIYSVGPADHTNAYCRWKILTVTL